LKHLVQWGEGRREENKNLGENGEIAVPVAIHEEVFIWEVWVGGKM